MIFYIMVKDFLTIILKKYQRHINNKKIHANLLDDCNTVKEQLLQLEKVLENLGEKELREEINFHSHLSNENNIPVFLTHDQRKARFNCINEISFLEDKIKNTITH